MRSFFSVSFHRALVSLVALLVIASSGCSSDPPQSCGNAFVYGLSVTVTPDAVNGCGTTTVTAASGNDQETLMLDAFDADAGIGCFYTGAGERTGTFVVTVSRPGFVSFVKTVTVSSDGCGPITQKLTFDFDRDGVHLAN